MLLCVYQVNQAREQIWLKAKAFWFLSFFFFLFFYSFVLGLSEPAQHMAKQALVLASKREYKYPAKEGSKGRDNLHFGQLKLVTKLQPEFTCLFV